jgi:hypothetical protein
MSDDTLGGRLYPGGVKESAQGPSAGHAGIAAPVPAVRQAPAEQPSAMARALYGGSVDAGTAQARAVIEGGKARSEAAPQYRGQPLSSLPAAADPASISPYERPSPPAAPQPPAPPAGEKSLAAAMYGQQPGQGEAAAVAGLPEGFTADPVLMGEFQSAAKEMRLDQTASSKLLALHAKSLQAQEAAVERQSQAWANETREYWGGNTERVASEVRERLVSLGDDGRVFLQLMGDARYGKLGNHPAVLRVLQQLSREY